MIKAQHKYWAQSVFHPYVIRLLRKHFYGIYLMEDYPKIRSDVPILLMPNHATWWDGFFVYLINDLTYHRPLYLMMLEEQLLKYSFFSKVGAYSVNPGKPTSVLESMKYSLDILQNIRNPAALLCIFPQGEMSPVSTRSIKFQPGFEWLLKNCNTEIATLLLAMRVEYLQQQNPEVFFQFIALETSESLNKENLEIKLSQTMDEMIQKIISGDKGELILSGKRSTSQKWSRFSQRLSGIFRDGDR
jgi:hypothetical protein